MSSIERIVNNYVNLNPFSGQIVIAKYNQIIAKFEFGFKDFEAKIKFSNPQIFPIASITKQFVAAAILYYVEQNKIEVNKYIKDYLPREHLLWQGKIPEWASQITLHHLLCHSSGIANYYFMALENPLEWKFIEALKYTDIYPAIINKIKPLPLTFNPGSKFAYNDINYLLLGIILAEFVPNRDLGKFFNQQFFKPLDLNHTSWPSLEQEMDYINNIFSNPTLPKRYSIDFLSILTEPTLITTHGVSVPAGGGGHMLSTPEDLLKWSHALHGGNILTSSSLDLMRKIHISTSENYYLGEVSYGYGIIREYIDDKIIYWHPGTYPDGLETYLSYDPFNQMGVAIMCNLSVRDIHNLRKISHPGRLLYNLGVDIHRSLRKFF